jgi:DNA-binding LytR/AlgR family response regulator
MFHILIVEDIEPILEELRLCFAREFPDSTIDCARTVNEGLRLIDSAREKGWPYHAAVLDFMLPKDVGEEEEVAESLCCEIRDMQHDTLVIHITSYIHRAGIAKHPRRLHQERSDPRALMIDKSEISWVAELLKNLKSYLYGNHIEARMDQLFRPSKDAHSISGFFPARRSSPDKGSLTIELAILCCEIASHWKDLDHKLQNRIKATFDVDTAKDPVRISLT